jgi:hypothetical protein
MRHRAAISERGIVQRTKSPKTTASRKPPSAKFDHCCSGVTGFAQNILNDALHHLITPATPPAIQAQ